MTESDLTAAERRRLDALALALVPWSMLLQGYRVGLGNHDTLLSFIRRVQDPLYLGGDWMLSTPPVHPQLTLLLASLVPFTGEEAILFLMHAGTRVLLLLGLWRLVVELLPRAAGIVPWVLLAAVLEPRYQLGGHYLHAGHWEPAFLGMALAIWTLATGLRTVRDPGHWPSLALSAGLGIFAHLFINLPVAACTFLLLAGQRAWKPALAAAGGTLLLGAPSLIPAATGFLAPGEAPLPARDVIQLLQFRHPHHHQPWMWPVHDFVQAGFFLGAGAWLWWQLHRRGQLASAPTQQLLVFGAYFLVSCTAFTLLGALQVASIVAYFQPFRLLSLVLLLAAIPMLLVLADAAAQLRVPRVVLLLLAVVAYRMTPLEGPVLLAAAALLAARRAESRSEPSLLPPPAARWAGPLGTLGAGIVAALLAQPTWAEPLNRLRREHWVARIGPDSPDRAALRTWIRRETTPSDAFAIPPAMGYFRIWEERPIIVDFKNVPYRNADLKEWAERYALLANCDPYARFTVPPKEDAPVYQILLAAEAYGARYAVVRESLDDPAVVYSNASYSVVDLRLLPSSAEWGLGALRAPAP